ncbi:MAG TPA: glycogen synthase GlgA [Casimicrobiaceae bacterium]
MAEIASRVLFATAECAPLIKTGGLGDVSGALPVALQRLGFDVRVLLPGYPVVLDATGARGAQGRTITALAHAGTTRLVEAELPSGVPLIVVDHPWLYDRPGGPYQDPAGADWPDNPERFGLLSKVAALLASDASPLGWRPDVVHCHDWHAALAPAYLRMQAPALRACPSVMTVHNLAYQGIFPPTWVARLELPAASFTPEGVEFHGSLSFLKAGLRFADAITTVSPTYAREIQTGPLGFGLDGLLRARGDALFGVLNGIDTEEWDPAHDPLIAQRYDAGSLDAKAANRTALQAELGLAASRSGPLFGVVSRLVPQKGIDLVADIAERLIDAPAQLVVLGSGDAALEQRFVRLAEQHRDRIAARLGFDNALAHRIEAGADAFLMPSRFEPCGMNQMFSQRYGTPPIVRRTGGLADTVVDATPATLASGTATGLVFDEASADALLAAALRAATLLRVPETWRALQQNAMARDFSWTRSARSYAEVYARAAAAVAATR